MSGSTVPFSVTRSEDCVAVLQKDLDLLCHPWFPVQDSIDTFVDSDILNTGPDVEEYC